MDVVSPVEHIGLLQQLRVSQQTAWEEREFFDDMMTKEVKPYEKTAMMVGFLIVTSIIVGRSCSG